MNYCLIYHFLALTILARCVRIINIAYKPKAHNVIKRDKNKKNELT